MTPNFTLQDLAQRVGGRCEGPANLSITGVAGIREAQPGDCTFLANAKYLPFLTSTQASALIAGADVQTDLPVIRVEDPSLAFLRVIEIFSTPVSQRFPAGVHPSACIDPSAQVGAGVHIGPHVTIDAGCVIGDHTILAAGTVVLAGAHIGARSILYPNVIVREECEIGERVILHAGVVVGSDGFGFAKDGGAYHKIPQIGRVVVEDDVEIGSNSCIDRATTGRTVIGAGSKIDNLVQVAHNVVIGRHCVVSAQAGISGSTRLGDDVVLAGQVGLVGHIEVGDRVRVGAQSGVSKSIPAGEEMFGYPAQRLRDAKRLNVHVNRLPKYASEIAELRRRLDELEKAQSDSSAANA